MRLWAIFAVAAIAACAPSAHTVSVTLYGALRARGHSVAGTVTASSTSGRRLATISTDPIGNFDFTLASGRIYVIRGRSSDGKRCTAASVAIPALHKSRRTAPAFTVTLQCDST